MGSWGCRPGRAWVLLLEPARPGKPGLFGFWTEAALPCNLKFADVVKGLGVEFGREGSRLDRPAGEVAQILFSDEGVVHITKMALHDLQSAQPFSPALGIQDFNGVAEAFGGDAESVKFLLVCRCRRFFSAVEKQF